ncbi:RidA family protein (plasmid) [Agrobacterium leguminum]|uniref:RutC family protein HD_0322 n=1 Tax=Agrobacterium deltaense NCPPB 1641 TaxID=1183425 RepID=A0A1S7U9B3_9HYPH|nr:MULTISPECIES: RidA family protein [Agrobacterium]WFS70107.1 RidA family protein [Agrobacterium leguminum]CVI63524.1 RutC family protein HD_0322 [Agrobacterium deltaense NCPPB 1641]
MVQRSGIGKRMCQASIHNGTIYLAGQVAAPGKSTGEQTLAVLDQIEGILKEHGSDRSKLLQVTVWLQDMADYDEMNAVWDEWVAPNNGPGRATCQAKLYTDEYRVEMIATAAL